MAARGRGCGRVWKSPRCCHDPSDTPSLHIHIRYDMLPRLSCPRSRPRPVCFFVLFQPQPTPVSQRPAMSLQGNKRTVARQARTLRYRLPMQCRQPLAEFCLVGDGPPRLVLRGEVASGDSSIVHDSPAGSESGRTRWETPRPDSRP